MPPYWDPLGEFEPHTTKYKLTVFVPPRPGPRWLPSIFTSTPATAHPNSTPTSPSPDKHSDLGCLLPEDLVYLATKTIVLKSWQFPYQMRCEHTQGKNGGGEGVKGCNNGCYVLEKGEGVAMWKCNRGDCEGHVYGGDVKSDEHGRICFGKKGERIVCLEPLQKDEGE